MKSSFIASLGAVLVSPLALVVHGFPSADNLAKLARQGLVVDLPDSSSEDLHRNLLELKQKRVLLDPLTKPIDVTGLHAFKPPNFDNGDQRGPCPGLNALANHGYIPRDGVVGFLDLVASVNTVYGMGIDLITILAVMGTVGVGNPLSLNPGFSIGGSSAKSNNILNNLLGLLGTPRGLHGAHNWIESDSSNTRDDLYLTNNAWTMNMTLFLEAYNTLEAPTSMDDLAARAAKRFDDSVATNPYFYYGPYTGMIARNAGYAFAGRILSNHTTEHPRGGYLTKEVFASFYAVYEEDGELVYKEGWEQIPANWYRLQADYGLVDVNLDIVNWALKYPQLLSVGGNMGEVNSFAGVDLGNVTGGLLGATSLLEGNNLICFTLQIVKTFAPDSLSGLFKVLEVPLQLLDDALLDPLLDLSCPVWHDLTVNGTDLHTHLRQTYPGARLNSFAL
ncbi:Chloroperoxidase [Xylariaceae sp. FL1272]|nr:Chloroperoxidase [Xylariaceae sp. FL1272]